MRLIPLMNKRAAYWQQLLLVEPDIIIAPFGFNKKEYTERKLRILVSDKKRQKLWPENWEIRQSCKAHAKLALGTDGLMITSWNFSETGQSDKHEIGVTIYPEQENDIKFIEFRIKCLGYFEELWAGATKL